MTAWPRVSGDWGSEAVEEGTVQQQQTGSLTIRRQGRSFAIKDQRNKDLVIKAQQDALAAGRDVSKELVRLPYPELATRKYKPRQGAPKKRTVTRPKSS